MKIRPLTILAALGLPACNTAQTTFDNRVQQSQLFGVVSYLGQIKSTPLSDWCGTNFTSNLILSENGQLTNVLVTLGGDSLTKDIPPHLAAMAVPHTTSLQVDQCRLQTSAQVIRQNGTVTIQNTDSQNSHSIYLIYRKAIVRQVSLVPGASATITLPRTGFYQLGEIRQEHWLAVSIYVTTDHFFTKTDNNGRYSFGQLPPGKYKLHLRHQILGEIDEVVLIEPNQARQILSTY